MTSRQISRRLVRLFVATVIVAPSLGAATPRQRTESTGKGEEVLAFGGKYQDLAPRQKSLIDDLYH